MRGASLVLSAFMALGLTGQALALEMTVGVAAPLNGTFELLGQEIEDGAKAAAAADRDNLVSLDMQDDSCSGEGGKKAAEAFAAHRVPIVIGFLCTEAIEAALPVLEKAGIPVVTPSVRTDSLTDRRDRTGWPVFRLAPRADAEAKAVSAILVERWRDELFAIIDDGTIYGRELAESFRAAAELAGLKPVYVDTYRPQLDNQIGLVGRLKRAGATHVFIGGDRGDVAIIARDAARLDYDLTIAGGEALRAEGGIVQLAPGVMMIGLPRWADVATPEALQALARAGIQPDGYVVPAYAALQVAGQAAAIARDEDATVANVLSRATFRTALGDIRFDAKGDADSSFYRLFRFDGRKFVEVE